MLFKTSINKHVTFNIYQQYFSSNRIIDDNRVCSNFYIFKIFTSNNISLEAKYWKRNTFYISVDTSIKLYLHFCDFSSTHPMFFFIPNAITVWKPFFAQKRSRWIGSPIQWKSSDKQTKKQSSEKNKNRIIIDVLPLWDVWWALGVVKVGGPGMVEVT